MAEFPDSVTRAIQETGRPEDGRQVPDTECQKFLDILLENVGKKHDGGKPLNIALVGPPGVGKSSFLSSLFAALSQDKWMDVASSGSHGLAEAKPITVRVEELKKCGMELIPKYANKYKDDLLPTLIDLAGIENEDNAVCKELLKIVFFGRLPKGEALIEAKKYGENFGTEKLREKYSKNFEDLKVDRIIFLASATEPVPTKLIRCVLEAAKPGGEEDNIREIPFFGYMTKVDRVTVGEVSKEDFEDRRRIFIESLGLKGTTTRFKVHKNYCDDTDPDHKRLTSVIPEIDAPLLLFMTQVCSPTIRVINPEATFESEEREAEQNPQNKQKEDEKTTTEDRRREEKEAEQNPQNKQKKEMVEDEKTTTFYLIQTINLLLIISLSCIVIYAFFCWLVSLSSKLESQPPTHKEL